MTEKQQGILKGRSSSTNFLELIEYTLNAVDNKNHVEAFYTDISKVFNRIVIPLLFLKFHNREEEPKLLESNLTNRQQIIIGKKSNPIHVSSSNPQVSHLEPLIFMPFVNDISLILKRIKVPIYADDLKFFFENYEL